MGRIGWCCPSATALSLSRWNLWPHHPRLVSGVVLSHSLLHLGRAMEGQRARGCAGGALPHVRRALGVAVPAPSAPLLGTEQTALSTPLRPRLPKPSRACPEQGAVPPSSWRCPRLASPGPSDADEQEMMHRQREQAKCRPAGPVPELVIQAWSLGREELELTSCTHSCLPSVASSGPLGLSMGARIPGGIYHISYTRRRPREAGLAQVPRSSAPRALSAGEAALLCFPKRLSICSDQTILLFTCLALPSLWPSPKENPYQFIAPVTQVKMEKLDDPEN